MSAPGSGGAIPVMRPRMPSLEQVAPFLDQMDECAVYSNFGPHVQRLEAEYASFLNVSADQVVTVSSATLGIEGAVRTTGVKTWFVPDFTFPATGLAVLQAHCELVLVDVEEATWEVADELARGIPHEAGVIPVMAFGGPIDLRRWQGVEHVIIDAAASLGAAELDLSSLPETWSVVFSLHATKVLPAGEGGIVVFGDSRRAQLFRAWSNFGFRGTRVSTVEGTNAKMSEIHAAYALASLANWPKEREEWLAPLTEARSLSRELGLASPRQDEGGVHPYWVVDLGDGPKAQLVATALAAAGIGHRFWWPSLHEMPAFARVLRRGDLQVSKRLSASVLGLPMFRGIEASQLRSVATVVRETLSAS